MYFQECERLANEHPELEKVITKVDDTLNNFSPGEIIIPAFLAKKIDEKYSQVRSVFRLLESDLLDLELMIECIECQNLMDLDEYEKAIKDEDEFLCSQCNLDLTKIEGKKVEVFRLKITSLKEKKTVLENKLEKDIEQSVFKEELSIEFKEDVFKHSPLLRYYSKDAKLKKEKPFAGKRIFILLHFLRDLMPFMESMVKLGLEPNNTVLFYKSYPYPQRDSINDWLIEKEYKTYPTRNINQCFNSLEKEPEEKIGPVLIIEDGGLIVPMIHRKFPKILNNTIGAVEQTTRGIMNTESWMNEKGSNSLAIPLLSVAGSKIKEKFEPPYIAEAVINNLKYMLPENLFRGKEVGILGFGTIGEKIADFFTKCGSIVTVFDTSSTKRLHATTSGFRVAQGPVEATKGRDYVVGATGKQSIDDLVISNLKHDTYLLSASSEQYEIDVLELSQQSISEEPLKNIDNGELIGTDYILPAGEKCIHLLANGYPINFWGMDSMPGQASDVIMSLIFLASVEISRRNYKEFGINKESVNEIAENYKVSEKFLQFHN